MEGRTLDTLIIKVKELLLNKNNISPGTIKNYENDGFRVIRSFFNKRGFSEYSNDFIEDCIQFAWEAHQQGARSIHQFQGLRKAALLLREVYETGTLEWSCLPAWNARRLSRNFSSIISDYLASFAGTCSSSTMHSKENVIRQFLFFLVDQGETELSGLSHELLLSYLKYIAKRRPVSMGAVIPTIRSFLLYLKDQGITCNDFNALLNFKYLKRITIKPIFTENESERILESIDRTSAQGKRDYAIFMIAKHNGLRSSDILNLKLCDINWKRAEITIVQRKTGNSVICPLDAETGNAIADYILHARPDSQQLQYVFLKIHSPYGKIISSASLCQLLKRYMLSAGVSYQPGEWKNTHTFRRTLGTRMLESETPLTTIMQVLGQRNPQSTKSYLSISEQKLSECPLDLTGFEVTAEGLL